jgi:hypothetical protein
VAASSSSLDAAVDSAVDTAAGEDSMKRLKSRRTANPGHELNPDDAAKPSWCSVDRIQQNTTWWICRV